jgi:Arc/MetJ family transcription regulator
MRTNIVLDDELIKEAFKFSDVKTKKDLVNLALKEFIDSHKRKNLMDLHGNIVFEEGYDYKALREGKL